MQLYYFLTTRFEAYDDPEVLQYAGRKFFIITSGAVQGRFTASSLPAVKKLQRAYAQAAMRLQKHCSQPKRPPAYEISRAGKYVLITTNGKPLARLPRVFARRDGAADAQAIADALCQVAAMLEQINVN